MKRRNLGWAWKGDEADQWLRKNDPKFQPKRRGPRKPSGSKKERRLQKRRNRLLYAPGEIFYVSKRWQKLRRTVLETYGRKCMQCDRVTGEMHVDHIKPRSKFPELSLTFDNLQVLCRDCNMAKMHYHSTDYRNDSIARDIDLDMALAARSIL